MPNYEDEIVSRVAPRWAWDIIDQTLGLDAQSKAFDAGTRADVNAALDAMIAACEKPKQRWMARAE